MAPWWHRWWAFKVNMLVPVVKMDRWKTVAVSQDAPDRCVSQTLQEAWLGPSALDVRLKCEVCLVFGSDIRHPFHQVVKSSDGYVKMVASDLLMY